VWPASIESTEYELNMLRVPQVKEKVAAGQVPMAKYIITKQLTKRPEDYPDAKNQPHVQVALRRKAAGARNGVMQVCRIKRTAGLLAVATHSPSATSVSLQHVASRHTGVQILQLPHATCRAGHGPAT